MSTSTLGPDTKANAKSGTRAAFVPGLWNKEINVRNFIQANYEPYFGDHSFLAGTTERTLGIWKK